MKTFVKIKDNLSEKEVSNLDTFLESHNIYGIEISCFGGAFGPVWDKEKSYNLDHITKLSNLKGLSLFLPKTTDLTFLPSNLNWLNIGEFDSKKVSLKPIATLDKLLFLSLVKNSNDIAELSKLTQLRQASFSGYKLNQLEFVSELIELESLYLGFGGGENINFLNALRSLKKLDILRIRSLFDISVISRLSELECLKIEDQAQITELPDFSNLKNLKHLSLVNLKSLTDISALENSHIKELVLLKTNLTIEQLKPLVKSKIERICISMKNKNETQQIEEILGNRIVSYVETDAQRQNEIVYYTQKR
ncbi:hypothetical protein [Pseudozobellia sp. WGM2]|uniref:hypothetical protein n=1 Tax=Pseudozobellia sp. WGM2 TaxID=2787625 RepID=UPI001ADF8661|nr:hypothetical protein [Pseudozobellia sp. WGM2]